MKKIIILNGIRILIEYIITYYPSYKIAERNKNELLVTLIKEGIKKDLAIDFDSKQEMEKAVNLLDEHFLIEQTPII